MQDTAYGSLLRGPRQALHARIAAAMQARDNEIAERVPEIIAHHLAEAGDPDGAAFWWLEAGQRSARRSANVEAIAHLSRGVAGLKGLPETPERRRRELELQLALGPALFSLHGFGAAQAQAAYERARVLAGTPATITRALPPFGAVGLRPTTRRAPRQLITKHYQMSCRASRNDWAIRRCAFRRTTPPGRR